MFITRLLFIYFYTILLLFKSFSHANNDPYLDVFTFEASDAKEQFSPEEIITIQTIIAHLYSLHTGRHLIDQIRILLLNKYHIHVKRGEHTCFQAEKSKIRVLELIINLESIKKSRIGCIGGKKFFVKKGEQPIAVYQIGSCSPPPTAIIGHELIHALHYLMNPDNYRARLLSVDLWYNRRTKKKNLDQLIWHSLEEQLTVIGFHPDRPYFDTTRFDTELFKNFTELQLRKECQSVPQYGAGQRPRYAYQPEAGHFYESAEIIESILKEQLGRNWSAIFNRQEKSDWQFNEEIAKNSRYNEHTLNDYVLVPTP